jgi:uncharacterized protein YceK
MHMRKFLVIAVLVPFLLTGCATIAGLFSGSGPTAERVLADVGCLTALAGAAVQVAGDPMVGGAATVLGVLAAIERVGASSLPSSVLSACAASLAFAKQDAAGAATVISATTGTAGAGPGVVGAKKPTSPKKVGIAADVNKAPKVPTVVTIPLPDKSK